MYRHELAAWLGMHSFCMKTRLPRQYLRSKSRKKTQVLSSCGTSSRQCFYAIFFQVAVPDDVGLCPLNAKKTAVTLTTCSHVICSSSNYALHLRYDHRAAKPASCMQQIAVNAFARMGVGHRQAVHDAALRTGMPCVAENTCMYDWRMLGECGAYVCLD